MALARRLFVGLAGLLAVGVAVQVFLAGLAIFADPGWWGMHRTFVHAIEAVVLLLLALSFPSRLPASLRWFGAAPLALIAVQYATIELGVPVVAALHPVNAFLIFGLAVELAGRARALGAGEPAPPPAVVRA